MSEARLVITAIVVEGRSQSEVARSYGVSQGWISKLVARYRLEGEAAFEPRPRRPQTSPTRLPQATIDLIITLRNQLAGKGLDHGPHTLAWHLHHHHGLTVSSATIHRRLKAAGLITPTPQKSPRSSCIRFAAEQPNERWQADFTHWWLADGTHVEILNFIDDHARYALSVTAHRRVTGPIVVTEFRKTVANHGIPYSTLTDNGMVFTTRFSGGKGGRNPFETELHRLGVTQINSTPNHPTTCGKVERFHQTLKKWLTAPPGAPGRIAAPGVAKGRGQELIQASLPTPKKIPVGELVRGAVITQVAAVITPNAYSTEFSRRNRTTSLISSAPSSN